MLAVTDEKRLRAVRALIDAGFSPDSVVAAVQADDLTKLHRSARLSVQLQPKDAPRTPQEQSFLRTLMLSGYTPEEAEQIVLRMPPLGEAGEAT